MSHSDSRSSTLPGSIESTALHQQAVDDTISAYVDWREESMGVWTAYSWWARVTPSEAADAYAAYRAALDREQAAAEVYRGLIGRVSRLVRARLDNPPTCPSSDDFSQWAS
jgi:hypothetical protein